MKGFGTAAPVAVALSATSAFANILPAAFLHPFLNTRATSLPEVSVVGNGMSLSHFNKLQEY